MKHTFLSGVATLVSLISTATALAQDNSPEVFIATASQDADGNTEADMNQALLQLLEKLALETITKKTQAALSAQGVTAKFPPLIPSSTYTTIGGKKLAIVKLRNKYANQVVSHGIVGNEFRRVICAKTRNFEIDVPVFYGDCGEAVRSTFELKGLPAPLKVK